MPTLPQENPKPRVNQKAINWLIAFVIGIIGVLVGRSLPFASGSVDQSLTKSIAVQESSAVVDVVDKVNPSVVSIVSEHTTLDIFGRPRTAQSAGTGFFVADRLIMTNKHVAGDTTVKYKIFTQTGEEIAGKLVAIDPLNDLALIKIDSGKFTSLELGDSSAIKVGQRVIAFGNSLGQYQNSVTTGIVSGIERAITAGDQTNSEKLDGVIQTDAAINPGNSGGPLVDISGNVIGVNTAVDRSGESIGFALPINLGKSALKSYLAHGKISRPRLGIRYLPITKQIQAQYGLSVSDGAYLIGDGGNPAIVAGGPADQAGIRAGDIITAIGGQKITQHRGLSELIQNFSVGDKVKVTVLRNGKSQDFTVTLTDAS